MRRTKNRAAASGSRLHLFRGLLFTLVALCAWVLINVQNLQEYIQTYNAREQEREQIDALKLKIKRLKREQQSLAYNGIETEKQARERLNLHLPGEQVLFLKQEEDPKAAQQAQPKAAPDPDSDKKSAETEGFAPAAADLLRKTGDLLPGSKSSHREKPTVVNKTADLQ